MIIKSDACTINIINESVNETTRIIIDDSIVMLQIIASHTEDSRGVIYNRNMFIVQPTVKLQSKLPRFPHQ
jgi:hypothetical protein